MKLPSRETVSLILQILTLAALAYLIIEVGQIREEQSSSEPDFDIGRPSRPARPARPAREQR